MSVLLWLLPMAAILHIVEEFAFPGGFTAWYRNYKHSVASSFTAKYLINVNVLLVVLCILPLILDVRNSVALWLSMAAVVFFNAFFHIRGAVVERRYVPGVVSSVVLYIPVALFGFWYFLSVQKVPVEQAIVSGSIGVGYWLFSSFNHKRRAKKNRKGIKESPLTSGQADMQTARDAKLNIEK
jgi:hypothetical protein